MSNEENAGSPVDPIELWGKLYEQAAIGWSNTNDGSEVTYKDPFVFYQTWMKSAGKAQKLMQEQLMASSSGNMNLRDAWKRWFEIMTEFLEKSSGRGTDPLGLTTQWLGMMEEARTKILSDTSIPEDPFTLMKQWYDATHEAWAKVIGDIIGTKDFMELGSQFLESYASLYRTFRHANEEFFSNLQLPTRSDIARIAELVIGVEDKVESIESTLEDYVDTYSRFDPAKLEERLEQFERKLDVLPDTFQKLAIVDSLEKRLGKVEITLDKLLIALEKIEIKDSPKSSRPSNPNKSKAQAAKRDSSKGKSLHEVVESIPGRTN